MEWLSSDHAPISIELQLPKVNMDIMLSRASNLGGHGSLMEKVVRGRMANRPIGYGQIDVSKLTNAINNIPIPDINNDAHAMADNISNTLYSLVSSCVTVNSEHSGVSGSVPPADRSDNALISRWDRLLQDPDDARVWKALNWKGQFTENDRNNDSPSDVQFKDFYDNCIIQYSYESQSGVINNVNIMNVPIIDNQINPIEVSDQINIMKENKSCCLDGIHPGVYKLLTPE